MLEEEIKVDSEGEVRALEWQKVCCQKVKKSQSPHNYTHNMHLIWLMSPFMYVYVCGCSVCVCDSEMLSLSKMLDDFTDVNKGEKKFMKLWNLFVMENK